MNCDSSRRFLDAYLDGELETGMMLQMEAHLSDCPECAARYRFQQQMQYALREGSQNVTAPESLRRSVEGLSYSTARNRWFRPAIWIAAAAAILLGILVVSLQGRSSHELNAVVEDMVARHVRELPMEISDPREDRATSWFQGKIDFPVRPLGPGLRNASFEGARVSNVREHQAAQMVYRIDGHKVTFMVFPARDFRIRSGNIQVRNGREFLTGRRNGYNVAMTREGDMIYAVSSELSPDRLVSLLSLGR